MGELLNLIKFPSKCVFVPRCLALSIVNNQNRGGEGRRVNRLASIQAKRGFGADMIQLYLKYRYGEAKCDYMM